MGPNCESGGQEFQSRLTRHLTLARPKDMGSNVAVILDIIRARREPTHSCSSGSYIWRGAVTKRGRRTQRGAEREAVTGQ